MTTSYTFCITMLMNSLTKLLLKTCDKPKVCVKKSMVMKDL